MNIMKYKFSLFVCVIGLILCAGHSAHAATGGGGLPWEAPLTTLSNSITGPVAYGASIIGIVGAGGILIFAGGQINEFLRAVMYIVLVIAFVIAAKNTMTAFGWEPEQKSHGRRLLVRKFDMALRRVTIHRAGIRPHLFLGGDRELVLFSGLIAFVLPLLLSFVRFRN
jgi:type IV secretion system protein VirB2